MYDACQRLQHVTCENTSLWYLTIILPTVEHCCLPASRTLLFLVGVVFGLSFGVCMFFGVFYFDATVEWIEFGDNCTIF